MRMHRVIALCAAVASTAAITPAQIVDFDAIVANGNQEFGTLETEGFRFTSPHAHILQDFTPSGGMAQNGSPIYIGHEGGTLGQTITMQAISGGTFSLLCVDATELWINPPSGFPNATEVRLTGTFKNGSTIVRHLPLDGVVNGAGAPDDFQTFVLSGFDNLVSVDFDGVDATGNLHFAIGIDNIGVVTGAWENLGSSLEGSKGKPCLISEGDLTRGSTSIAELTNAGAGLQGCFILSLESRPLAILGGTLLAYPAVIESPFITDQNGKATLNLGPVPGTPSGSRVFVQAAMADPGSVLGLSMSNALLAFFP